MIADALYGTKIFQEIYQNNHVSLTYSITSNQKTSQVFDFISHFKQYFY